MKLKFLFILALGLLALSLVTAYHEGYQAPKNQGTPGSGLLYSDGRVTLYQNPQAFTGSGVYQQRLGDAPGPSYNPYPMPNTGASHRDGRYSSYIFLDNQLAYNVYTNPDLLKPRYMTNNLRFLRAEPYSYQLIGPRRDKRAPLLDVSRSDQRRYRAQMGYLI